MAPKLISKVGLIKLGLLSTVYEIFGNPRDLLRKQKSNSTKAI